MSDYAIGTSTGPLKLAGGVVLIDYTTGQPYNTGGGSSAPAVGTASLATGQVSAGTSATLVVAARTGGAGTGRTRITAMNNSANTVYFGGAGVTSLTGVGVPAGASLTMNTTAALYAVAASASAITYWEEF